MVNTAYSDAPRKNGLKPSDQSGLFFILAGSGPAPEQLLGIEKYLLLAD